MLYQSNLGNIGGENKLRRSGIYHSLSDSTNPYQVSCPFQVCLSTSTCVPCPFKLANLVTWPQAPVGQQFASEEFLTPFGHFSSLLKNMRKKVEPKVYGPCNERSL